MAYPARNFEKDPSKRTKGWYMVPGKGRRYWDGKAFKFRSPDGTVNLKGLAGSVINRVKKAAKTKSTTGRAVRGRNRGRGSAVQSESGPSRAPKTDNTKSGQNNPNTQNKPKVEQKPVTKPKVEKKPVAKAKQTGDRGKDMATWAKANKKLAQRFLDKHKNKKKKPSGYASVLKALKEDKAKRNSIDRTVIT